MLLILQLPPGTISSNSVSWTAQQLQLLLRLHTGSAPAAAAARAAARALHTGLCCFQYWSAGQRFQQ
jgi:hypothetical protein